MEKTNMSKSRIIGTWVGIFAFIAAALGALEHASKADPAYVGPAHASVREGAVVSPFRG
jgi:hypothetical protein